VILKGPKYAELGLRTISEMTKETPKSFMILFGSTQTRVFWMLCEYRAYLTLPILSYIPPLFSLMKKLMTDDISLRSLDFLSFIFIVFNHF